MGHISHLKNSSCVLKLFFLSKTLNKGIAWFENVMNIHIKAFLHNNTMVKQVFSVYPINSFILKWMFIPKNTLTQLKYHFATHVNIQWDILHFFIFSPKDPLLNVSIKGKYR